MVITNFFYDNIFVWMAAFHNVHDIKQTEWIGMMIVQYP